MFDNTEDPPEPHSSVDVIALKTGHDKTREIEPDADNPVVDCEHSEPLPHSIEYYEAESYSEPVSLIHPVYEKSGKPRRVGKTLKKMADGEYKVVHTAANSTYGHYERREATDCQSFFQTIRDPAKEGTSVFILGDLHKSEEVANFIKTTGCVRRTKFEKQNSYHPKWRGKTDPAFFKPIKRCGYMIDFDPSEECLRILKAEGVDILENPEHAAKTVIRLFLPPEMRDCKILVQFSSSAGTTGPHHVSAHFFFWLAEPLMPEIVKGWVKVQGEHLINLGSYRKAANGVFRGVLDTALFNEVQAHFIADPIFENCPDPIHKRWLLINGRKACVTPIILNADQVQTKFGFVPGIKSSVQTNNKKQLFTITPDKRPVPLVGNRLWPKSTEQCEKLIGDGPDMLGFHEGILAATYRKARDIEVHKEPFDETEYLTRLRNLVIGAPRGPHRSNSYIEDVSSLVEIKRALDNGRRRVIGQQIAKRSSLKRCQPRFDGQMVPRDEALEAVRTPIERWVKKGIVHHRVQHRLMKMHQRNPDVKFFSLYSKQPRTVLAAEMGLGKTRAALRAVLSMVDLQVFRIYVIVPEYNLANEWLKMFDEVVAELYPKVEDRPTATIYKGIGYSDDNGSICQAEGNTRQLVEMAKQSSSPLNVSEVACPSCPLRAGCAYHAQFEDTSPGLKIMVSSYLTANAMPGLKTSQIEYQSSLASYEGAQEAQAPLFGVIFDERFNTNKEAAFSLERSDNKNDGGLDEIFWRLRSVARDALLNDGRIRLSKLVNEKVFAKQTFEPKGAPKKEMSWIKWALQVAYAQYGALQTKVQKELEKIAEGESSALDQRVKKLLAERAQIKGLIETLKLIKEQQYAPRDHIYGVQVESQMSDEIRLKLSWRALLPGMFAYMPILYLDGTADEKLTPVMFEAKVLKVGAEGALYWSTELPIADDEFVRIKAQQPHAKYYKVLYAPVAKGKLANELKNYNGQRLQSHSVIETIIRQIRLLAERVEPSEDGSPSVGVFTYKVVREYIERHAAMPAHVSLGHFNATAGSNDWVNARLIISVGRPLPSDDDLHCMVEGFFALDGAGRAIDFDGGIVQEERGLRVSDGHGLSIKTEVCRDDLADRVLQQTTCAQVSQVIYRGRGPWCDENRECLHIDLSNVVPDISYDAVIDYEAFEEIDEFDVMAQGIGLLPARPSDQLKVANGVFENRKQAQKCGERRNGDTHYNKDTYNTDCRHFAYLHREPINLSSKNVLYGNADHPLLQARQLAVAQLGIKRCKPANVVLDPQKFQTTEDIKKVLPREVHSIKFIDNEAEFQNLKVEDD